MRKGTYTSKKTYNVSRNIRRGVKTEVIILITLFCKAYSMTFIGYRLHRNLFLVYEIKSVIYINHTVY